MKNEGIKKRDLPRNLTKKDLTSKKVCTKLYHQYKIAVRSLCRVTYRRRNCTGFIKDSLQIPYSPGITELQLLASIYSELLIDHKHNIYLSHPMKRTRNPSTQWLKSSTSSRFIKSVEVKNYSGRHFESEPVRLPSAYRKHGTGHKMHAHGRSPLCLLTIGFCMLRRCRTTGRITQTPRRMLSA